VNPVRRAMFQCMVCLLRLLKYSGVKKALHKGCAGPLVDESAF
jgi:hypothetical protein